MLEIRIREKLTDADLDRIIQMAWQDRTSFDPIRRQFGMTPGDVIKLMRQQMTANSFKLWRKRNGWSTDEASGVQKLPHWAILSTLAK